MAPEPHDIAFELVATPAARKPWPSLLVLTDGACLARHHDGRCRALQAEYVWLGEHGVRLLTRDTDRRRLAWRWSRRELGEPAWRRLCRWAIWVGRGMAAS